MPQANWHTWSAKQRTYMVKGKVKGRKAWHLILAVDDDYTILQFLEKTALTIDALDYGIILKSGWGEGPTDEEEKSAMKDYQVYQEKPNKQ